MSMSSRISRRTLLGSSAAAALVASGRTAPPPGLPIADRWDDLVAAVRDHQVVIVAGVTADRTSKVKAGELVASIASVVGGKGGGRPDFAQAGGTDASRLADALAGVLPFVRTKLL